MKRNELCNLMVKAATKEFEKWRKKHPKESPIEFVQQINMAALELKTMGSKEEELYKKGLTGTQYHGH